MSDDDKNFLFEMSRTIGEVQARTEIILDKQEKIFTGMSRIVDMVHGVESSAENFDRRLSDIESNLKDKINPVIDDYKTKKTIAAGIALGAGLIGAATGAGIKSVLIKLGILGGV